VNFLPRQQLQIQGAPPIAYRPLPSVCPPPFQNKQTNFAPRLGRRFSTSLVSQHAAGKSNKNIVFSLQLLVARGPVFPNIYICVCVCGATERVCVQVCESLSLKLLYTWCVVSALPLPQPLRPPAFLLDRPGSSSGSPSSSSSAACRCPFSQSQQAASRMERLRGLW